MKTYRKGDAKGQQQHDELPVEAPMFGRLGNILDFEKMRPIIVLDHGRPVSDLFPGGTTYFVEYVVGAASEGTLNSS